MRSLAKEVLAQNARQFAARVQILNEWAAIYGGLLESNVGGQPYVGYNALLLSQPECDKLAELTECFGRIMTKALQAIVEAGPQTYRKLGWPELLDYALRYEPLNRYLTAIGRFDFGLDSAGEWHLLEYNSDTPSGSQEVTLIEERLFALLSKLAPVARLNPNIGSDMARAFYEEALFPPLPYGVVEEEGPRLLPRLGLLTQSRHLTDLAQTEYYAARLRELGLECVVSDLLNVSLAGDGLFLRGQPVDAIWRLYPIESFAHTPLFAAYTQANIVGSLKCLNNLRGFLAQSKAVMAWVWQERENAALFDPVERATITRHLPETYLLSDLPPDFDYRPFIIKEFYGREGAEVYDGAQITPEEWQAYQKGTTFVAQRRVNLASVPHPILNEQGEPSLVEAFPCVGSFLIADRWGGCYSRIGDRITNSQAQFIPTWRAI
ncbi:MAG: glutathionylspermidine synthase family protein [Chloroflexi bacterium]|nr:glutathionylspermidine synthase family protein [Chloroflexota bacterium]